MLFHFAFVIGGLAGLRKAISVAQVYAQEIILERFHRVFDRNQASEPDGILRT